jgi:hypothetical protein
MNIPELNLVFHDILPDPKRVWDISGDYFQKIWNIILPHLSPAINLSVTFDDGLRGAYEYALPFLSAQKVSATWFVVPDWVGSEEKFMNWNEIRNLVKNGHRVGSHTLSHPSLFKVDEDSLYRELTESKKRIEDETSCPCLAFAAPFGHLDARICRVAWLAGYREIYSTIPGWNWPNRVFQRRTTISQETSLDSFSDLLDTKRKTCRVVVLTTGKIPLEHIESVAPADRIFCISREASELCMRFALVAHSMILDKQPLLEEDILLSIAQALNLKQDEIQLEVLGEFSEDLPNKAIASVRIGVEGDEVGVSTLTSSVFQLPRSPAQVQWKSGPQPWQPRPPATVLAEEGGLIQGMMAITACRLAYLGKEFIGYQAFDNCVSLFFRKQGIQKRMWDLINEIMLREQCLMFGFSNELGHKIGERSLRYEFAGDFRCLKMTLPSPREEVFREIKANSWFDLNLNEVERLWREIISPSYLCQVKSASFLRWRYLENPFYSYEVVTIKEEGILKGVAIFRIEANPSRHAVLYDWIVKEGSSESVELLKETIATAQNLGCMSMIFWCSFYSKHREVFLQTGFRDEPLPPFRMTTVFPIGSSLHSWDLGDNSIWQFTLGDSDL